MRNRLIPILLAMIASATAAAGQDAPFALDVVAEGLDQPLFATAPAGDSRLFIVEQTGAVRILEDGVVAPEPFLDIGGLTGAGGERGLLGLAFHPEYGSNGRIFVNYTDRNGDTQIAEYRVSSDPAVAEATPARVLLAVEQPFGNHNGGWIGFGPDGLLYIGMGDGGSGGDPQDNGQNSDVPLGKILRMDVDGGGPETFALGVRNPWRNAFDGENLYVADVGQRAWEEVSVVSLDDAGANLGWNTMEGFECFEPRSGCDPAGLVLPIHAYSHDEGCSITGGYVYRGQAIPAIVGHYFFADYCSGTLWSLRYSGGEATALTSYADDFGVIGPITSFGLDSAGEMYLMTQDGQLMRFVPR